MPEPVSEAGAAAVAAAESTVARVMREDGYFTTAEVEEAIGKPVAKGMKLVGNGRDVFAKVEGDDGYWRQWR